jgi:hypothetical protein
MKNLLALTALVVSVAGTVTVRADSLEEKKFWQGQMDYVNEKLKTASEACDVKFTFDWVDKTTLRDTTAKNHWSPNGVCTNIVDEVGSLCRAGKDEKDAVKAKIKGFTCGYAEKRTLDLSKAGIVKYMGNNAEANFSDWAKPWLMKHL